MKQITKSKDSLRQQDEKGYFNDELTESFEEERPVAAKSRKSSASSNTHIHTASISVQENLKTTISK